uniref:CSON005936 protein n=2 Tax=Culicoides sonorensis TaxID=179676 RepID=A0A336MRE0_CULSO
MSPHDHVINREINYVDFGVIDNLRNSLREAELNFFPILISLQTFLEKINQLKARINKVKVNCEYIDTCCDIMSFKLNGNFRGTDLESEVIPETQEEVCANSEEQAMDDVEVEII